MKHLWPGKWEEQVEYMNVRVKQDNLNKSTESRDIKQIMYHEFWVFWGIMLAARIKGRNRNMWDKQVPEGIDKMVNYKGHMAEYRFNQMKTYMLYVFADEEEKGENAWWKIKAGIKGYNDNQKSTVRSSPIKVFDESVSAFCPQVSSKGNLPHLSMIARKPKLLGTKLKVTADSTTGIFLYLELQKGQLGMADSEYSNAMLKTSASCC